MVEETEQWYRFHVLKLRGETRDNVICANGGGFGLLKGPTAVGAVGGTG